METYRSNAARHWALTLLYTALAPVPLASFAGEGTNAIGKAFIKSYTGVCLEGAVIILACLIFTAFASSAGGRFEHRAALRDAENPGAPHHDNREHRCLDAV